MIAENKHPVAPTLLHFRVLFCSTYQYTVLSFDLGFFLQMMMRRHKIEKDLDIGSEVGFSKNAEVARTSPTLAAMNKKFGMIHGLSSLANIMAFGSLAMHSWYLASKLQI